MFELQRSRTPVALQILGSGVYWMPWISLRCTDTARALPPDMGLRRLGWSLGSKRSRSKPQSHDHGNDTEHAGCHKTPMLKASTMGGPPYPAVSRYEFAISPSVDWTEG